MHERKFLKQFSTELAPIKTIFMSHHLGRRKPYGGIYREIASILAVSPDALVFFDDLIDNVAMAKQMGWDAHLYENAALVRSICGI